MLQVGCARRPCCTPLRCGHDVRVIGTLGVILRAKKRGQVESARPLVKKLGAAGTFIGEEFLEGVLASIGE
jgi:predicted nucleic acid-binding protein